MRIDIGGRIIAAALGVFLLTATAASSQETEPAYLVVDDPRPVAKALEQLSATYNFVATYEDPRYSYVADTRDVTLEVRKDLDKFAAGAAPRVIVPIGGTLNLTYAVLRDSGKPQSALVLVQQLVDTQNAGATGGKFRIIEADGVLNVVPTSARDRHGEWMPQTSVLDIPISISESSRDVTQVVRAICDAVTKSGKARLAIGSGPYLYPAEADTVIFGATNENARVALQRALKLTGKKISWQIFYAPDFEMHFINLRLMPERARAAPPQPKPPVGGPTPKG